jgi:hypothetical protein
VIQNGVRDDVFLQFTLDDGRIILINLDDFLDVAINLAGEQFLDEWHNLVGDQKMRGR